MMIEAFNLDQVKPEPKLPRYERSYSSEPTLESAESDPIAKSLADVVALILGQASLLDERHERVKALFTKIQSDSKTQQSYVFTRALFPSLVLLEDTARSQLSTDLAPSFRSLYTAVLEHFITRHVQKKPSLRPTTGPRVRIDDAAAALTAWYGRAYKVTSVMESFDQEFLKDMLTERYEEITELRAVQGLDAADAASRTPLQESTHVNQNGVKRKITTNFIVPPPPPLELTYCCFFSPPARSGCVAIHS